MYFGLLANDLPGAPNLSEYKNIMNIGGYVKQGHRDFEFTSIAATPGRLYALKSLLNTLPQSLEKRTFSLYTFKDCANQTCMETGLENPGNKNSVTLQFLIFE
jgi:hypothetical protein